jgi:hypothetical protein
MENEFEKWVKKNGKWPVVPAHEVFKAGMIAAADIAGNDESYRTRENSTFYDTVTAAIEITIKDMADKIR